MRYNGKRGKLFVKFDTFSKIDHFLGVRRREEGKKESLPAYLTGQVKVQRQVMSLTLRCAGHVGKITPAVEDIFFYFSPSNTHKVAPAAVYMSAFKVTSSGLQAKCIFWSIVST